MPQGRTARHSKSSPPGALYASGKMVGFTLFAGLGIATFAAVVLLPAYASLVESQYERDCLAAKVADLQAFIATRDRQIREIPNDPVYTRRLLASHQGLLPANEVVLLDPQAPTISPAQMVQSKRHPRPPRPEGALLHVAGRLESGGARRGLCLLSVLALAAAFFYFSAPQKYRTTRQLRSS